MLRNERSKQNGHVSIRTKQLFYFDPRVHCRSYRLIKLNRTLYRN
jgi:hypothetical protein